MKKYTKIAYIVLILIILLFGFSIYKVFGKNSSSEEIKNKTLSEIKDLESKFSNLFNQLNNINFENYMISSSEIKKEDLEDKESSSSKSSKTTGESSNDSEQSKKSGESSGNSQGGTGSSVEADDSADNNKQYNLEKKGVLTNNSEIDWKQIKNDVEDIYKYLYPATLDLYQTTINQQDIVNFNKEYDNLTKAVKDENKNDTLMELSILYDYLPRFIENCTDNEKEKIILRTKNSIFKAYSVLDKEEWITILENINNATQEFTKIVTDISNQENRNQYNINKAYIMINELQNAVELKDKEVFLIKYKNLLEELKNI